MANNATEVIVAVCAVVAICLTVAGGCVALVMGLLQRVTRVEERVGSLGRQLAALPKRKGD